MPWRRLAPTLAVLTLMVGLSALTTAQALSRYRAFRTGWSWDLAYYNQWCWSLTQGDGVLSVRPLAAFGEEGPRALKMNYLTPIRFALLPIYRLAPGPETLLVVQNLIFWWIVPATFTLARAEARSDGLALLAAGMVPLTPLAWPLVWNDFRELQVALPFAIWAIQGYRSRNRGLAAFGIVMLLACRQEFGLVVATLGLVPSREPEDVGRSYLWAMVALVVGLSGLFLVYFAYLHFVLGPAAPRIFVEQFTGPKPGLGATLATALDLVGYGLGPWAVLALFAPRVALMALPWVWSIAHGKWALRFLAAEEWHHVRYCAPILPLGIAAGAIGLVRFARWLPPGRAGSWGLVGLAVVGLLGFGIANREILDRLDRSPRPIDAPEAEAIWRWVDRVGPDEAVVAVYQVTAPLSSRRHLYSYVMDQNKPKGYPTLEPACRWVFLRKGDALPQTFTAQGFQVVHDGRFLTIFRR